MWTRKSLISGRARTEVVGMCGLSMRLCVHVSGMKHAADGPGKVEVGPLMVMGSPVKMGELVR